MIAQIQMRRGTAAAWTSANPTLAAGEEGDETDTGLFKKGDGSTAWNSLSYSGRRLSTGVLASLGVTPNTDLMTYFTSATAAATTSLTSAARTMLALSNVVGGRSTPVTLTHTNIINLPDTGISLSQIDDRSCITIYCPAQAARQGRAVEEVRKVGLCISLADGGHQSHNQQQNSHGLAS